MYRCDGCGKICNQTTNIMIVLSLCNSCLDKYYSGELFKKKSESKEKKNENN